MRLVFAMLLVGMTLACAACSSSPSPTEQKKLEGDRIPKGAGPGAKPQG